MAGFVTARLKYVPIFIVSAVLNLVSLLAFLVAYVTWYAAALFYPNQPRKDKFWYGFADFKDQYQISALLGVIASIFCIIAPPLIIPTAWLYTISNIFWTISEFHKQENPPLDDELYSSTKQAQYLRYTFFVASGSLIAALTATMAFLFPPAAVFIIAGGTILGIGLTIASLYIWTQAAFGNHSPDHVKHSYKKLSSDLAFDLEEKAALNLKSTPNPKNESHLPFLKSVKREKYKEADDIPTSALLSECS